MFLFNKRIFLPSQNLPKPTAPHAFDKGYFYLGLGLMLAFALQENNQWSWPLLSHLQADHWYKQLSGIALLTFLAHQWHCSVLRTRGLMSRASHLLKHHKVVGSLAPLFFYAHAQSLGYAYQQLLSLVFFAIVATGLFNFETTRIHKPWFQTIWIVLHVGFSTSLLFLIGYHIYISYAYQ